MLLLDAAISMPAAKEQQLGGGGTWNGMCAVFF